MCVLSWQLCVCVCVCVVVVVLYLYLVHSVIDTKIITNSDNLKLVHYVEQDHKYYSLLLVALTIPCLWISNACNGSIPTCIILLWCSAQPTGVILVILVIS